MRRSSQSWLSCNSSLCLLYIVRRIEYLILVRCCYVLHLFCVGVSWKLHQSGWMHSMVLLIRSPNCLLPTAKLNYACTYYVAGMSMIMNGHQKVHKELKRAYIAEVFLKTHSHHVLQMYFVKQQHDCVLRSGARGNTSWGNPSPCILGVHHACFGRLWEVDSSTDTYDIWMLPYGNYQAVYLTRIMMYENFWDLLSLYAMCICAPGCKCSYPDTNLALPLLGLQRCNINISIWLSNT